MLGLEWTSPEIEELLGQERTVGMGLITNNSTSFPGYNGWIRKSAAFVSEILRQNGYATSAFGKWHVLPDWESGPSGPFDRFNSPLLAKGLANALTGRSA